MFFLQKSLCFIICLLWFSLGFAGINNPLIINFSKTQYGAANKNWSISEDEHGILYFGNDIGLLEFDGIEWKLNKLPKAEVVRSVYAVSNNEIYTGGYEEFGKWSRQPDGELTYTSLSKELPTDNWQNDDIWRILPQGESIYFQSFSGIFRHHLPTGKTEKITKQENFHFLMQVGSELWIQETHKGLLRLQEGRFTLIPHSELFLGKEVKAVLPYAENQRLVVTSNSGLFIYDGDTFRLLSDAPEWINSNINCAIQKENGHYLLGTILNGVYMIDRQGKIIKHINSDAYMQNNTILFLHEDKYHNTWLALDNGITCIQILPELSCYTDPTGKTGAVYAAALFAGKLFIGTNQGLFYISQSDLNNINALPGDLQTIENIKEQIWDLKIIDGKLYCGSNSGLKVIDEQLTVTTPINAQGGVFTILAKEHYLLLGTYASLKIVDTRTQRIILDDIRQPIVNIQIDHLDNVWLEHMNKGVYRCQLSEDMTKIKTSEYYGEDRELPYKLHLFKIGGRVVMLGGNSFYTYNDIGGKVELYEPLKHCLSNLTEIKNVSDIDKNHFYEMGDNVIYRIAHDGSQNHIEDKIDINYNGMSMVNHFERIIALTDSTSLICLDNGFLLCPNNQQQNVISLSTPYIKSFSALSKTGEALHKESEHEAIKIPFTNNTIEIRFATDDVLAHNVSFQYKLEGISEWSEPERINKVTYERLPKGTYTFLLRSIDNLGNCSPTLEYTFTILSPWYQTIWAILGYFIIALLVLRIVWILILRRYRNRHLIKIRLREAKRLSRMNQQLQNQIKEKDAELLSQTSFVIQRNELITQMKDEIEEFYRTHNNKALAPLFHKINMLFNNNLDTEEDWKMFLIKFEEKHTGFFKQLKTLYPQLTANDLKLCACLKLNLDSKAIAALMNISVRAVENSRYRLRKKINIPPNENLNDFFLKL